VPQPDRDRREKKVNSKLKMARPLRNDFKLIPSPLKVSFFALYEPFCIKSGLDRVNFLTIQDGFSKIIVRRKLCFLCVQMGNVSYVYDKVSRQFKNSHNQLLPLHPAYNITL